MLPLKPSTLNVVFNSGGLGDCIARLPAIRYLIESAPHLTLQVVLPDFLIDFAKVILPKTERLKLFSFSQARNQEVSLFEGPGIDTKPFDMLSFRMHPTNLAFVTIARHDPEFTKKVDKEYPRIHEQLKKQNTIVIGLQYRAPVKAPDIATFNFIITKAKQLGLTPILLGSSEFQAGLPEPITTLAASNKIDTSGCIDLRDKTTLKESASWIESSQLVVSMDSGLIHLAGCTSTPILGLYTHVEPKYWEPVRATHMKFIGLKASGCLSCQSSTSYVFDHDFNNCYFGKEKACNTQFDLGEIGYWMRELTKESIK